MLHTNTKALAFETKATASRTLILLLGRQPTHVYVLLSRVVTFRLCSAANIIMALLHDVLLLSVVTMSLSRTISEILPLL